jgi:hypothetical protein
VRTDSIYPAAYAVLGFTQVIFAEGDAEEILRIAES